MAQQPRVFISYKNNVEPDDSVATKVAEKFKELGYYVFIDKDMLVGMDWGKRIEEELTRADFLIPFLSQYSIHSEMVKGEIEKAHHLAIENKGRPKILPVRLNYREPFPYPISVYLNHINWALWDKAEDTPRLINELVRAISGSPLPISQQEQAEVIQSQMILEMPVPTHSAQPMDLEMPEGTMDPESAFYIERHTDRIAIQAIERQGVTITIKAPRQMGKSSLLMRIIQAAAKAGKRVAFLDFQLFDKLTLTNADTFYQQFCTWLTDELDIENRVDEYWKMALSNSQRCTRYMGRYLLKEINGPLVLAMDEVETIFDTIFRSDFFGMLRSWHNQRRTGSIWKNFDLALVTSTEPYQLIENLNQSPFNVGEVINLMDFTDEQVSDLNRRHGTPFDRGQEQQLMSLLNGHPYLVRRAMYLVASQRISAEALFAQATDDHGPFGDHLRYHLFRIHDKKDLIQGLRQVIDHNFCQDEKIIFRLQGAGLVKRENGSVVPRCKLYAVYFKKRLYG